MRAPIRLCLIGYRIIVVGWHWHRFRCRAFQTNHRARRLTQWLPPSPLIGDGGEQRKLGQAVWLAGIGMCIVTRWLDVLWVL